MEIVPLDEATLEAAKPLGEFWEYDEKEFRRLVDWTQGCGRVVLEDDEAVGMALGFPYGPVGWIGDVLVLETHRGHGIGGQVTEASVQALQDHGCRTVKLYATPKAIGLYERLGFQGEGEVTVARGGHRRGRDPPVVPLADHVDAALELDKQIFGGDRSRLIRRQLADHPELSLALVGSDGDLAGFAQARPSDDVTEIGPVVVRQASNQAAQELVDGLLVRVPEGEVEVTYPAGSWAAKSAWECRGFMPIDAPLEMRLGPVIEQATGSIVATGGQELG